VSWKKSAKNFKSEIMAAQQDFHLPVLLKQTVDCLLTNPDGVYVDGTVGGGGHALQILSRLGEGGDLIAVDQDPEAIQAAKRRLSPFGEKVSFHLTGFQNLPTILRQQGIEAVDGILLDLGVSSHQLDSPERGFSYRFSGPLDMRMNLQSPKTAWQVVNSYSKEELGSVLRRYGEERMAAKIARIICWQREEKSIDDTLQLREIIESTIHGPRPQKTLSRIFQVETSVRQCINLLKTGGRLCIISYHSLEDRIVKSIFRQYSQGCICPPRLPVCVCGAKKILKLVTKKAVLPSEEEKKANRRARSAKLRVAEKIADSR
jgi:16S rRNA (cytosine1402-N4)-methyltransferase